MTFYAFNRDRQPGKDENGNITASPHKAAFGVDYPETLVIFGMGAYMLDESVTRGQKFDPRSKLMVILAPHVNHQDTGEKCHLHSWRARGCAKSPSVSE